MAVDTTMTESTAMFWNSSPKPDRRQVIRSVTTAVGLTAISGRISASTSDKSGPLFTHGVASGDPLQNKVILWTRVINQGDITKPLKGEWQLSADESFTEVSKSGSFSSNPTRDHTVKVDVEGLSAGSTYYYRFIVGDIISSIGRTKTLPEQIDSLSLAVVSCANYSHGFFNVYKELASRSFQAILHLGDYIYEYAVGKYENSDVVEQGRAANPKTEVVSLEEYRTRYAQYRGDPDLQAAHAAHPFICVWDDHEVANDSWKHGAENHSNEQGDYEKRRQAAMQAYREWLPIRETKDVIEGKIYRSFELGQLGSLIMMDTRHVGRDRVLDYAKDLPMRTIPFNMTDTNAPKAMLTKDAFNGVKAENIKHITVPFKLGEGSATPMTDWQQIKSLDPKNLPAGYTFLPDTDKFKSAILGEQKRSIMGAEQEEWLADQLEASAQSGKPWQILGQQLLSGKLGIPQIDDSELDYDKSQYVTPQTMAYFRMLGQMGLPLNLDAWDGYPACRERTFKSIKEKANNAVFLAGDTHNAWAFNLTNEAGEAVAVELGTPSVSSPGLESYIPTKPERLSEELLKVSKELHFVNSKNRGWLEVSITETELSAQWNFVSTVISPTYEVTTGKKLSILPGSHTLT
ncbi:MAG: alkaline phosphatase [Kordiimonas sp.]